MFSLTATPANLTVTANNASRVFGAAKAFRRALNKVKLPDDLGDLLLQVLLGGVGIGFARFAKRYPSRAEITLMDSNDRPLLKPIVLEITETVGELSVAAKQ
jgi:hypothetical protein